MSSRTSNSYEIILLDTEKKKALSVKNTRPVVVRVGYIPDGFRPVVAALQVTLMPASQPALNRYATDEHSHADLDEDYNGASKSFFSHLIDPDYPQRYINREARSGACTVAAVQNGQSGGR